MTDAERPELRSHGGPWERESFFPTPYFYLQSQVLY